MNLELTFREESLLRDSVQTRIRTVEELIHGWEQYPDKHTSRLVELYSEDLEELKALKIKLESK